MMPNILQYPIALFGVLRAGMVDRRIVCTRRKDRPSGKEPAERGEEHYVYRRNGQPCRVCGTKIMKREGFAGRNLFWCPVCQAEKPSGDGER